ncbi:hypothetical protein PHMEG_0004533 [Phytophthora megakarya]|uniref:Uncharacterized protein n=1 Tax=Phytophthora megakarya TaxID=4795 RepID=A0A225WTK7_9STRA|nr:hypothetical protein PHMEG_0004533 [Phytophthora megakarya]
MPQEFYKMNIQVEELQGENTELRLQLELAQDELKTANACIAQKLPAYKLAAVKANAELRCVKSQLKQERAQSDGLQKQLVRYKARKDDVTVRASPERGNHQDEHEEGGSNASEATRRERKIFLQQCMRLQGGEVHTHEHNPVKSVSDFEKQTVFGRDFESSSKEPIDALKAAKLIDERLNGLEFYIDELSLSD